MSDATPVKRPLPPGRTKEQVLRDIRSVLQARLGGKGTRTAGQVRLPMGIWDARVLLEFLGGPVAGRAQGPSRPVTADTGYQFLKSTMGETD